MKLKRLLYFSYRKITSFRAQVCLLCILIPTLFTVVRIENKRINDETEKMFLSKQLLMSKQYIEHQTSKFEEPTPFKPRCGDVLTLEPFPKANPDKNRQIFYVETTFQPNIIGRSVCSIESAIDIGKLPVKYILRNTTLKLENPNLCDAVEKYYPHKLQFYTTTLEDLFSDTPLASIVKRYEINYK